MANLLIPALAIILWILLLFSLKAATHSSMTYEHWTLFSDFGSLCCFYANFSKQIWNIGRLWNHREKEIVINIHLAMASINLIAGSSSLLRFVGWDALCEDTMGFALPLSLWVEWLVCVPTLGLIATFTDEIDKQPNLDIIFIATLELCILFGFCSTWVKQIWVYLLLLVGSHLAFFVSIGIVVWQSTAHRGRKIIDSAVLDPENLEVSSDVGHLINQSIKSKKLRRLLMFVFPPFPILYLLGTFRALSLEWAYVGLCIANFGAKYLFLANACELHMDLVDNLMFQLKEERILNESRRAMDQLKAEKTLNESRREYLRYVFHEVRVPLNSLSLGLNVLMDKNDGTDDEREALLMMQDSATFMADTLNDVLSMSQIEEGKMSLKFEKMAVRDMLQRALSTLKGAAVGKGIELLLAVHVSVPVEVMADKFRLEHVVANLVSNAIKFSPSGSKIGINVKADEEWKEKNSDGEFSKHIATFEISVKDEGNGLSAEDIGNLFTPFQQIRPDAVQQRNGTGLGLSLARSIVQLHGGELTCESELGHGCTFIIRLPLEVCDTHKLEHTNKVTEHYTIFKAASPRAATKVDVASRHLRHLELTVIESGAANGSVLTEHVGSIPKECEEHALASLPQHIANVERCANGDEQMANSGDACIAGFEQRHEMYNAPPSTTATAAAAGFQELECLIVDDTSSNRKMLAMVLSKKKLKCAFAEDGLQGVEAVRAHPGRFDIIFMDNTMPVMTGMEATRVIRSEGFSNLVIGVTGNALDDDVAAFLAAGADMILAKPMRPLHLEALLAHIDVHGCGSIGHELKIVDGYIHTGLV